MKQSLSNIYEILVNAIIYYNETIYSEVELNILFIYFYIKESRSTC